MKMQLCILNGPDIRKLIKSEDFSSILNDDQKIAWVSLKCVIERVLGKHRDENHEALVKEIMKSFQANVTQAAFFKQSFEGIRKPIAHRI